MSQIEFEQRVFSGRDLLMIMDSNMVQIGVGATKHIVKQLEDHHKEQPDLYRGFDYPDKRAVIYGHGASDPHVNIIKMDEARDALNKFLDDPMCPFNTEQRWSAEKAWEAALAFAFRTPADERREMSKQDVIEHAKQVCSCGHVRHGHNQAGGGCNQCECCVFATPPADRVVPQDERLIWGDDGELVRAGVDALMGHHPERGGSEREQAVAAVLKAFRSVRPFVSQDEAIALIVPIVERMEMVAKAVIHVLSPRSVPEIMAKLRTEFIVCYARGYPDPFKPIPNTLESACKFQEECGGVIKYRLVADWKEAPKDLVPYSGTVLLMEHPVVSPISFEGEQ